MPQDDLTAQRAVLASGGKVRIQRVVRTHAASKKRSLAVMVSFEAGRKVIQGASAPPVNHSLNHSPNCSELLPILLLSAI